MHKIKYDLLWVRGNDRLRFYYSKHPPLCTRVFETDRAWNYKLGNATHIRDPDL